MGDKQDIGCGQAVVWWVIAMAGFMLEPFVLTYLWKWFVCPYFEVVELTWLLALALLMTVRFITYPYDSDKMTVHKDFIADAVNWFIVRPLLIWLVGYILYINMV